MTLLLADLLLLLSLLSVRPAAAPDWRIRLALHALLLAACLVASALRPVQGAAVEPALVGAAGCLLETWLVLRWLPGVAEPRPRPAGGGAGWLLAGLVLTALSLRLLPAGMLPVLPHAELAAALGIVLTGLLAAVAALAAPVAPAAPAAPAAESGDGPGRFAGLLLGGHGLVLAACVLPGLGWQPLSCVLLLQAWLIHALLPGRAAAAAP